MRKLITILTVLFLIVNCRTIPVNFKDCKTDQMFVKADTEPKWNCDSIGMIEFMNKYIIDENLNKIEEGRILVGILIYPDGKTCCHSFGNFTKAELNPEIIKEVINRMPNWFPAKQNEKEITFLKNQLFTIRKGKFIQN